MSFWLRIILIVASAFISVRFGFFSIRKRSWIMGSFSLATLFLTIHHVSKLIVNESYLQNEALRIIGQISGWCSIISIALVLCGLTHFIREAKPKIARFPFFFTTLPLLIIISFPLAYDNEVINNWLFQIYEGGAIIVGTMMYSFQYFKFKEGYYLKVIMGIFLLFISYMAYWFFGFVNEINPWLWQLSLILGIINIYVGYRDAIKKQ